MATFRLPFQLRRYLKNDPKNIAKRFVYTAPNFKDNLQDKRDLK